MRGQIFMARLAEFIVRHHKTIPLVGLALFVLCLISAGNIKTKTQIKDMLPMEYPQVASYDRITEKFSGGSSLIITVEGGSKEEMAAAAEALVARIRADKEAMRLIHAIDLKVDRDFITKWGLILQKEKDLADMREMLARVNLLPLITSLNDNFERAYTGEEAEEDLETNKQETEAVRMLNGLAAFLTMLREYLEDPEMKNPGEQAKKMAETFMYGDEYSYAPDYSMLMFSIYPNFSMIEFEKIDRLMAEIKQTMREVNAEFPALEIGYTGDIGMQADENQAMKFDLLVPMLVAFVLVALIIIFSYKQLRFISFSLITLVVGIVFNYGLLGVTIKEITIVTSMMGALLVGMGIDYGIQTITNFGAFLDEGLSPVEALRETFTKAGIGTLLAAATTATAFFVLAATGSKAFVQFGFVAGTGILCCYLAMTIILPALLIWFTPRTRKTSRIPKINYDFLTSIATFMNRHRWFTWIMTTLITSILFLFIFNLNFEYDLLKLEPKQMISINTFNKLMDKFEFMPTTALISSNDLEYSRRVTESLEKEPMIAEVRSISQFIPSSADQETRLREIARFRQAGPRYQTMTFTDRDITRLIEEIQRLEYNVIELGDLSIAGLGEGNKIVRRRNEIVHEVLGAEIGRPGQEVFQRAIAALKQDPHRCAVRLTRLDRCFAEEMDRIIINMTNITEEITLSDLPENIVNQFMDKDRKENLVTAFPKDNVMVNRDKLQKYNDMLTKISKEITGPTVIVSIWQDEIIQSSKKAALYIAIFIFLMLLFTLRSFRWSIVAVIPLVVGMVWMFGAYALLGYKLNMMNIMMTPLVIGMGINYGIYFVCRYIIEPDIALVYKATGKAVTLSALTTMFGFGALALVGTWAAIASMGMILFIGITASYLTSIFIQPALLGTCFKTHGVPSKQIEGGC